MRTTKNHAPSFAERRDALYQTIQKTIAEYQDDPEQIVELLEFKSKFYNYSIRNCLLIRKQNPYATFVASYSRWQELGFPVKRGSKAIKILAPRKKIVFPSGKYKNGNVRYKDVSKATPEEREKIKKGEIVCTEKRWFSYESVFDISNTTMPPQEYPKYYSMGVPSEEHATLYQKMATAAAFHGILVETEDFNSISLRGRFDGGIQTISLSEQMNDTERLSVFTHELGHALTFDPEKSVEENELLADCVSVLFHTSFGLEIPDLGKRHLVDNFQRCNIDPDFSLEDSLSDSFEAFRGFMEKYADLLPSPKENGFKAPNAKESTAPIQTKKPQDYNEKRTVRLEDLKAVPITELAKMMEFTVVQKGRCFSLKEHDSVMIYPETNSFYRFSTGVGGSNIDFLMHFNDMNQKEAIQFIQSVAGATDIPQNHRKPANTGKEQNSERTAEFVLPQAHTGKPARVMAYLIQTRKINPEIVYRFLNNKKQGSYIYEDKYHNVVFVGKNEDGKDAFATRRSTLTGSSFRGDVANSNQTVGFSVAGSSHELWVCEAPIDLLSLMCMHKEEGNSPGAINYVATCGTGKSEAVYRFLKSHPSIDKVCLANDNDEAGQIANQRIRSYLSEHYPNIDVSEWKVPTGKDINDYLVYSTEKKANRCNRDSSPEQEMEL